MSVQPEDLREFYITPLYLERLEQRARIWSEEFIEEQSRLFMQSHPDYPELVEILNGELKRRHINRMIESIKQSSKEQLHELERTTLDPELLEVIRASIEIRAGAARVFDPIEGTHKNFRQSGPGGSTRAPGTGRHN